MLGWEHTVGYAAAFIAGAIARRHSFSCLRLGILTAIVLTFNYALTTIREQTAKKQKKGDSNKNKNSSNDYTRLGQ